MPFLPTHRSLHRCLTVCAILFVVTGCGIVWDYDGFLSSSAGNLVQDREQSVGDKEAGVGVVGTAATTTTTMTRANGIVAHDNADNHDGSRRDLPGLIIHVGPPKTGTTTIQKVLKANRTQAYLAKDNYRTMIRGELPLFFKKVSTRSNPNMLPKGYRTRLQQAFENNHHVVMSDESLANARSAALSALWNFVKTKFNIQIVQTYRRYHELLPSIYNQRMKLYHGKILGYTKWPSIDIGMESHQAAIPTFAEYFESLEYEPKDLVSHKNRISEIFDKTFRQWKTSTNKTFVSFHVFNMHQEGDLVSNFVCQMIPNSNETCQFLLEKASSLEETTRNQAVVLDYDRLACYAEEIGVIDASYYTNRSQVATTIQFFHEKIQNLTDKDLPQTCPSPEMADLIYNASLLVESNTFVEYKYANDYHKNKNKNNSSLQLRPQDLEKFNESWKKMLDRQTMCNVDTQATLDLPEWKDFFAREFPSPSD